MRKIALHWQILLSLIISIIYGVVFHTNYKLTEDKFAELSKQNVSQNVVTSLKVINNKTYSSKKVFIQELNKIISENDLQIYQKQILMAAYNNKPIDWISWLGVVFMRALKMIIIPLVLSSIVSGVVNIGSGESLGRIGFKTISYYILTSLFAILTGLILVNIFRPGVGIETNFIKSADGFVNNQSSIGQTIMEIVPTNIIEAMVNNNMLSIIFFAIVFGFFITKVGNKSENTLKDFFNALFDVMMKITMWIIRFTPLGIFGIVAKVIADQDDLSGLAASMGFYMLTVILALAVHAFITLPFILKFIGKISIAKHFRAVSTPLLTAFSTSSSGATLPLTMNAVEKNCGVSNKISSFTLPLGATINMDGTALYECVAAIFIAQAYGVELSVMQQVMIVFVALISSIGAAAIPMAGFFMITVILTAVGLPLEGVGLVLSVDRILDMFRTSVNVLSDTCGAVVIAKSEGETLKV